MEASKAQLEATGKVSLPDFLTPETAVTLAGELKPLLPKAYPQNQQHNVYFREDDPYLPVDHTARHQSTTTQKALAYDLIPESAGIRAIYIWEPLRTFIARIVGRKRLYLHFSENAILRP